MEDRAYFDVTDPGRLSFLDLQATLEALGTRVLGSLDVTAVDDWINRVAAADLAVINLHGSPGEDGAVQGLLRMHGIPFVGSDVEASVVGLNKLLCKLLAAAAGVRTPPAVAVLDGRTVPGSGVLGDVELIAKPLRGGSSLGARRLAGGAPWPESGDWIVEQFVDGRDATVTVVEIEGRPVPLAAVVLEHGNDFYDADGKLADRAGATRPPELIEALRQCEVTAALVHQLIGARHVSRCDFVIHDGQADFLEINTIPGLSRISNAAESAYAAGLGYDDLIALIVGAALRAP